MEESFIEALRKNMQEIKDLLEKEETPEEIQSSLKALLSFLNSQILMLEQIELDKIEATEKIRESVERVKETPIFSAVPVMSKRKVKVKTGRRWSEVREDKDLGVWILPVKIEEEGFGVLVGNIIITQENKAILLVKKRELKLPPPLK